jgi:hypothetical protein
MKNQEQLDLLHSLFNTYIDVELENFKLQTKLLEQGVELKDIVPLTKSPKVLSLFASLGFHSKQLSYNPSYRVNSFGVNSLHYIRKPSIFFLYDDLWEVSITSPAEYKITSYFTGQYLLGTLKQGLGGVIPQMIKERTGLSIKNEKFKNLKFNMSLKLCLDHPNFKSSCRGNFLEQIDFSTSDSEVLSSLKPSELFGRLTRFKRKQDESRFSLIKERLKLWGFKPPLPLHKASEEQLDEIFNQLPVIDFGIKDIILLKQIVSNFHQTISNEVLLTGEVGNNIFEYRNLIKFNNHLKKLLK